MGEFLFGEADDELAEEIEINLGGDFLVYPFVDVIVLIGGLAFASFEMLIKLIAIFKEKVEQFTNRVMNKCL